MIIEIEIRGGCKVELSTMEKPAKPGAVQVRDTDWYDSVTSTMDDRPSHMAQKEYLREILHRKGEEYTIADLIQLAAHCHVEFGKAAHLLHILNVGQYGWYLRVVKTGIPITDTSTIVKFMPIPVCENREDEGKTAALQIGNAMRGVWKNMWTPSEASVTEWRRLCAIIKSRENGRLMMAIGGDPSIGKTYTAEHFALRGREAFNVTLTEDTFASELKGHAVIIDGGALKWFDGPALRAYRHGGRIVINEIQRAATNTLSFLLELTDSPKSSRISLPPPSGETITPHKDFQVIATYNGEFEDMPEALRSRFAINVYMHTANPEAIRSLPQNLHQIAAKTVTCTEVERRISLRHWQEFAALKHELEDEETAAWAVFGKHAGDILNQIRLRNA